MTKRAKLASWLDPDDVAAHMKLPAGAPPRLADYCTSAEAWLEAWFYVPADPTVDAPDLYLAAIEVTADLWADQQTTGGLQSGGPDIGFIRLGDFSQHVQNLLDRYRQWAEMFA